MNKSFFSRVTVSLLLPACLLLALGLTTLYSIDVALFRSQAIFALVALVAYVALSNFDYRVLARFAKPIYIVMIGLLLVLFVLGIEARGAVRWIDIFGLRIQFSELIKPLFVIFLASYLSNTRARSFSTFLKTLLLILPICFLILREPDLGNAIIFFLVGVFMLFSAGFSFKYFVGLGAIVLLPLPLIFRLLHSYQRARIESFFNVTSDPFGSSYNAIQALISIGSGGLSGKGFGQATQSVLKFLPERHTDFIFAATAESVGFIGGAALIALAAYLLYKIYCLARASREEFSRLVLSGFYFLLLFHIFLNIGMNMGIVPIVGITLPFVSYGGSSLLTNFVILAIISSFSLESRSRDSLEIR